MEILNKLLSTEKKYFKFNLVLIIVTLPLLFQFNWEHARDASAYAGAITELLNGKNPYESGVFRGGLVGASLIFLIAKFIPLVFQATVFLLLNILGVVFFLRVMLLPGYSRKNLLVYLIVIYCSSSREGLNTIQITGILLGLLAVAVKCAGHEITKTKSFSLQILGIMAAVIAVDLKPHFIGPALLIYFIRFKLIKTGVWVFSLILTSHLAVDILFGKWFTIDWARLLLSLASREVAPERAEFVNIWSIFSTFIGDERILNVLPIFLIAIVMLVAIRMKSLNFVQMWAVGFSIPLLSTFNHYYDYLPLVAICIVTVFTSRASTLSYFYLGIVTLTLNIGNYQGLVLVAIFFTCLLLVNLSTSDSLNWKPPVVCALKGLFLYLSYHQILNWGVKLGIAELALGSTIILLTSFLTLFVKKRHSGTQSL